MCHLLGKLCITHGHGHHSVMIKISNSVVKGRIIIYIMTISYNRPLMQHKNQLDLLLAESFPMRDYEAHAY